MLKIILCDDEEKDLQQLVDLTMGYLQHYENRPFLVGKTTSALQLLSETERGICYDIYILDIMMEEADGLRLGKAIRESNPRGMIIYVTSSPEYALGAFQIYASGYLMKPVEKEVFEECLDRVVSQMRPKRFYTMKTKSGVINIDLGKLVWIEAVSRIMYFHMEDGQVHESSYIRQTFESQLEVLFQDGRFLQPHKSFVINMEYVEKVAARDFLMADGTAVPISRNNLASAKKRYLEYLAKSDWR